MNPDLHTLSSSCQPLIRRVVSSVIQPLVAREKLALSSFLFRFSFFCVFLPVTTHLPREVFNKCCGL